MQSTKTDKKEKVLSSIRVSSDKLDELMNLVSELVTTQASLSLYSQRNESPELEVISENIEKLSRRLRDIAFGMTLVPINNMFSRFQRLVRDVSKALGKEVEFVTEGGDTELDKSIIETLTVGNIALKGKNFVIDGNILASGDIYAYASSDKQLKDNLIPIKNAIQKLNGLTGYEFDWNEKSLSQKGHDYGVVAQEVQEIFPEIVGVKRTNYLGVKYEKLIPLLIQAIKEQQIEIEKLKKLL
jgi:hypothetical protein